MGARFSAVIVRWRNGDELLSCIDSLRQHGGQVLDDVTIVDSGSGDGGAEALRLRYPDVRVEQLDENLGFAYAANHGAGLSTADVILLLNPDTRINPESLDVLANFLDREPAAPGAVPLLLNPDGTPQYQWQLRRLPTVWNLAVGRSGGPAFSSPPSQPVRIAQPAAAAWCIRRHVWEELDGFDTRYAPAWWEDVDFCTRLAALDSGGFWLVPGSTIVHQGGSSLDRLSQAEFITMFTTNLLRYAQRHHPHRMRWLQPCLAAATLARALPYPSRAAAYINAGRGVLRFRAEG